MRLLHTADWHLGRSFHGADLLDAQAATLEHLIDVVRDEQPDAVLVAGDVFDRAYPPVAAVALYDDAVSRLAELKVPVVITSGNHDSAIRLGMHARLAAAAGIHVRARADAVAQPIELPGTAGHPALLIYAIPYLDPPTTALQLGASEPSHAAVISAALARIAADRTTRPGVPAVVIAHGVVAGGRPVSEAGAPCVERSIDVGGVSAVPPAVFADADYVALGHLHRPQTLSGGRLRYSGAPLPFGFDEVGDEKSLSLVTLSDGAPPLITTIPTPQPRAIARLEGAIDTLLTDPALSGSEAAWVEVVVTDRLRPKQAMERLRRRFPHVLKLEHRPEGAVAGDPTTTYTERVRGRSPIEVATRFVEDVRSGIAADDDERALLEQALEGHARNEALR